MEDLRNEKEISVWTEVTRWLTRLGTHRKQQHVGGKG